MTAPVNPNETAEFARLISMMNGGNISGDAPPAQALGEDYVYASSDRAVAPPAMSSATPEAASDMKAILMAMYSTAPELREAGRHPDWGSDNVEKLPQYDPDNFDPATFLTARSENDRELREALMTIETDTGTRIGSWEITTNEDARGLKNFDVTNVHTGEPIATELTLYEAARGIVRHLNEGLMINSRKVREILHIEFEYARSRMNAAEARDRAKFYESRGDDHRQALMEDRLDDALNKAKFARTRIQKLTK
jgi:hypothetical protein